MSKSETSVIENLYYHFISFNLIKDSLFYSIYMLRSILLEYCRNKCIFEVMIYHIQEIAKFFCTGVEKGKQCMYTLHY